MNTRDFMKVVEESHRRNLETLEKKGRDYAFQEDDRLIQFKRAAEFLGVTPQQALLGMAVKHFSSIVDICKSPLSHANRVLEVLQDSHNYLYLLEALLFELYDEITFKKDMLKPGRLVIKPREVAIDAGSEK